ncbi:hypothetical protein OPT61_g2156 [Boeremia exigua]|uniref:Uncharacterized protein n=1 Tax=Boeremia exigua TaxID=749465 RepID=A0ACC2IML8_9PLEO|nr:hypothetical protein OPT61_g2156 [Boeremia exigua]
MAAMLQVLDAGERDGQAETRALGINSSTGMHTLVAHLWGNLPVILAAAYRGCRERARFGGANLAGVELPNLLLRVRVPPGPLYEPLGARRENDELLEHGALGSSRGMLLGL